MSENAILLKHFWLKKIHFLPFLLLATLVWSCNNSVETEPDSPQPALDTVIIDQGMFSNSIKESDKHEIGNLIKASVQRFNVPDSLINNDTAYINQALFRFYGENGYQPIWIYSSLADSAWAIIQPEKHGLKASDVHLDSLVSQIGKTVNLHQPKTELTADDWAKIDMAFTRALLWWGKVLAHGKTNPTEVNDIWNFTPRDIEPRLEVQLTKAAQNHDIRSYYTALAPHSKAYWSIVTHYNKWVKENESDSLDWQILSFEGVSKLEPGDSNSIVPRLNDRLIRLGFLDKKQRDTLKQTNYSEELQAAVARFQIAHGLNADSVVGRTTLELLNLSPEMRINAMRCSLERLRWIDHYLKGDYIVVNAPQYKMYYISNDSVVWQSRTIVGTTWNKTPLLTAEIERLVFNPTWTVPYSISSKELLPKLKKDSTYLIGQNMNLLDHSGNVIASTTVDYSKYNTDNFPYIIRQKPGGSNSLGLVKFHMPNSYYIFMHDTPNKKLFNNDQRTYSHGCIRLENPFELVEILLHESPDWKPDTIASILNSKKTTNYSLVSKLPIHVVYLTYFVDGEGIQFTLRDVYKRDVELLPFLDR